ncbi:MAG: OsmC family protein [Acidobacteriota bacterium]|nr:OsmC family protein [Acidobacteriota bacterium]
MAEEKPPTRVTLTWEGDLRFSSGADEPALVLDSAAKAGPSPMQALGYAVMACMGMDIVHVLQKGRHPLEGLTGIFVGERAAAPPRRFTRIEMAFTITGNVPREAADRALQLSRDTYCSVFNSMAPGIEWTVTIT